MASVWRETAGLYRRASAALRAQAEPARGTGCPVCRDREKNLLVLVDSVSPAVDSIMVAVKADRAAIADVLDGLADRIRTGEHLPPIPSPPPPPEAGPW